MTDIAYQPCTPLCVSRIQIVMNGIGIATKSFFDAIREWRHRRRSRQELALYLCDHLPDLGYAASLDAEIEKPFWKN
jgi:uncharacterized protein YjiS (DUF1127 family)